MASRRSSPPWPLLLGGLLVVLVVFGLVWAFGGPADAPEPAPAAVGADAEAGGAPGAAPRPLAPGAEGGEPERLVPTGVPAPAGAEQLAAPAEPATLVAVGRVVDPDGTPQVDMEVNLFDAQGDYVESELTDEQGRFRMEWDEPLVAGWSLTTEPDLFSDPEDPGSLMPGYASFAERWVPGDPHHEVELVLARAPRLEGVVLDDVTGAPIDFADVEVVSTLPAWIDEFHDTFSEEDGSFALSIVDMPARGLLVRATDDDDRVALVGPFDMEPGEVRWLELRVGQGFDLRGTVRSGNGQPVDGAEVLLLPMHPDLEFIDAWDITLDDGEFVFSDLNVTADQVMIYAQADGFAPTVVRPRVPRAPVDVVLGPPVVVAGRVLSSASGEPIDGADLTFVLRGPTGLLDDYEDYAFSEEDGSFEVELEYVPPQVAELIVEGDGHVRGRFALADLAPVESGWRRYTVEVRLDPLP